MTESLRPSYESIQQSAKGPGVEQWRRADKARSDLIEFYNTLQEDPRITDLARSEQAWERYEKVKAQVEEDASTARELSAKSIESYEKLSLPFPEGEGCFTKDTEKLLLTQGELSRINRRLDRMENVAGPLKLSPERISRKSTREVFRLAGRAVVLSAVPRWTSLETSAQTSTPLLTSIAGTTTAMLSRRRRRRWCAAG